MQIQIKWTFLSTTSNRTFQQNCLFPFKILFQMTKKYPFLSTHLFVKLYDERDSPQVISNCWKRIEVRVGPSPPDGLSIPAFPIYAETAGHIRESVRWLNWMYGGILRPEDVYRSIEQQSAVYFNLIQQNALISKPISTANMVCYFIIISRQHSNLIFFVRSSSSLKDGISWDYWLSCCSS